MKIKKIPKIFIILIVILVLALTDLFGWWDGIKRPFGYLLSGARQRLYQTIVSPEDEIDSLKKENASYQGQIIELLEENANMRRLLDAGVRPSTTFVLTKVIGLSNDQMLVFTSEPRAIKPAASVVDGRILIGRVNKIDGTTVRIDLINSRATKIPVKVWPDDNQIDDKVDFLAEGILVGLEDKIILKEVLSSEKISVGNLVGTTIETGEVFLIGKISQVFPSSDKIFQEAEIKALVDPEELITVAIVK